MNTLKGKIIAALVVVLIAAGAYVAGSGAFFAPQRAAAQAALYSQDTVTSVYNKVSPAVVEIDVTQQSTGNGLFRSLQEGRGSGFIVDSAKGYILTNNHVVDGASTLNVKFSNGKNVTAKVVGTDAIDDLAVISVDASATSGITQLNLGDSSAVVPGQMAIAIGNPFGYENTITVGVISGINRTITGSNYIGMLQTDAAINPGNSGGPLLDVNGNVIGINTAIESTATGARGIGFAVSSNTARKALPDMEAGKQISRPWLGISGTSITATLAQQLNLSVNQGVYIISVVSGSPAASAGLKGASVDASGQPATGGDVITAIDGKNTTTIQEVQNYVAGKNVGDVVTLTILRGGSQQSVQVTLGARPANVSAGNAPNIIPQPSTAPTPTPRNQGRDGGRYYYGN
jgi:S1-C subfamily serine protease